MTREVRLRPPPHKAGHRRLYEEVAGHERTFAEPRFNRKDDEFALISVVFDSGPSIRAEFSYRLGMLLAGTTGRELATPPHFS